MSRPINPLSCVLMRISAALAALALSFGVHAADSLTIAATGTVMPMLKLLIDDYARQSPDPKVELLYPPAGNRGAARAVASGKVSLAVASRPPEPGLPGAELAVVPWVKTAFVIVANHSVARNYTLKELAAIWSGSTLLWPDGQPIRLVLRAEDATDTVALRAMFPAMKSAIDAAFARPGLPRAEHDLHTLAIMEKAPGSLGTSTLGLLLSSGSRLTTLPVEGVTPSVRSLRDGTWSHQRTLYLISHTRLGNHPFIAYLSSVRALALLEKNGFVKTGT